VYSTLFTTLGEQEVSAAEEAGNQNPPKPPPFGSSSSEAAEVYAFYNWWGAFATSKEFAWADQYNPAAAPNRQVSPCLCLLGTRWKQLVQAPHMGRGPVTPLHRTTTQLCTRLTHPDHQLWQGMKEDNPHPSALRPTSPLAPLSHTCHLPANPAHLPPASLTPAPPSPYTHPTPHISPGAPAHGGGEPQGAPGCAAGVHGQRA
jgi:hypothetical protein